MGVLIYVDSGGSSAPPAALESAMGLPFPPQLVGTVAVVPVIILPAPLSEVTAYA